MHVVFSVDPIFENQMYILLITLFRSATSYNPLVKVSARPSSSTFPRWGYSQRQLGYQHFKQKQPCCQNSKHPSWCWAPCSTASTTSRTSTSSQSWLPTQRTRTVCNRWPWMIFLILNKMFFPLPLYMLVNTLNIIIIKITILLKVYAMLTPLKNKLSNADASSPALLWSSLPGSKRKFSDVFQRWWWWWWW